MNKLSKFFISAAIATTVFGAASSAQALTLRPGSSGYDVRAIQTELQQRGYLPRNISLGYYGSMTQRAVMNFQRDYGLRVNGVINPSTLEAMGYGGVGGPDLMVEGRYGLNRVVMNSPSRANTVGVVRVNSRLNVRSGPGTGYQIKGTLPAGRSVSVINEQNGWYQLEANNGEQFWVDSRYISVQ